MKALKPSMSLLCKLASVAVHADELLSLDAHEVDRLALKSAIQDAEVKEWIDEMVANSLAPRKRNLPPVCAEASNAKERQ